MLSTNDLKALALTRGGFTLGDDGKPLEGLSSGFVVSVYGHEKTLSLDGLSRALVARYMKTAKRLGGHFGLWLEDGQAVLDISLVFDDKEVALAFAKANKQRAYYDVGRGQAVPVNYGKEAI